MITPSYFASHYLSLTDPGLIQSFTRHCRQVIVKPKQRLIQAGCRQTDFFFLCEGIARVISTNDKGSETTDLFVFRPGAFLNEVQTLNQPVARMSIEALAPCTVYALPVEAVQSISDSPEVNQICNSFARYSLCQRWQVEEAFSVYPDMTSRYDWFCQTYPDLVGKIKKKHIASFLGTSAAHLSRICHTPHKPPLLPS